MSIAHWAAAHRRSILFLLLILALGGAASAFSIPVALFPHVDFPRIVVTLNAGDRPAEQMVTAVVRPIEQTVRTVPGITEIRSTTSRGTADLSINFGWGRDMNEALLQVDSAMTAALPELPPGVTFRARRMDPTVFPVAAYSLTSDKLDLVQLWDIAEFQLVPLLSSIDGVARVSVLGGKQPEYQVDVSPARLQAYGLSLDDVVKALGAGNILQAVGRLEDRYKLLLAISDTRFHDLDEIRHTVLTSGENGLVELEDIATVRAASVPQWIAVTADGHDAASVQIYQQPGGNTVAIVRDIRAKLAQFETKLPAGVRIANWYDQSQLITAAAKSVRDAIVIGAGLAALLLLVFLRDIRITLVAILVVPAVLAVTVLPLTGLDMSFNIMTLGGMAAAIGLIIDDAIVMIEHIVRRFHGGSGSAQERVRLAAREFATPLAGSSGATVIIFLPLAFLSGVTGAFFKALALTMASALIVSFLVAFLAIPLLAEHLLHGPGRPERPAGAVLRGYRPLLAFLIGRPWLALVLLAPLLGAGYAAYGHVGTGFMPRMDEGGFVLDYRAQPGTSLTETNRLLRQVEGILAATPEVATYSRRTGAALGGFLTETNEGDFFVRLKPFPRRPIEAIMNDVRQRIESQVPGLEIELAQLMEDLIGDLTAVPQPIEIKLYGDNPRELLATAPKVAAAVAKVPGVVDVRNGIVLAGDALDIQVDRTKAALENIDPEAVTRQIDAMLSGAISTRVQRGVRLIGVRVWVPDSLHGGVSGIADMRIRAADGHLVPLRRIATLRVVSGQPQITRDNLQRMIAVTARISGRDLGSTVGDVRHVLQAPGLIPKSLYFELGGLYHQQQIAFRGLIGVFAAAVALVFVLLLFLYERFRIALVILCMPMAAAAAAFIGLWLTGVELNISAMMGLTMVVGIVTEVAIFYFSEYRSLVRAGADPVAALVDAGVNRMRPIVMTTLAAILALLPLALALGQGSAMQQPLAIVIIAGLVVQMPLVLIVMPVLFRLFGANEASLP